MTIAYIPSKHPTSAQLPSLSDTKPTGYDNGQKCTAKFIRAVEDSAIYTATRCQLSMGGSCRKTNLSTGDSPATLRVLNAIEPFTAEVNLWIVASTTGSSNTISAGGQVVTLPVNESVSDWNQRSVFVIPLTVGSGDKSDLGTDAETVIVTINNGSVRVWSMMLEPVPLAPGNVTVS